MSMQHPTVVYVEVDGWPGYRAGTDGSIQTCRGNGRGGLKDRWKTLSTSKPGMNGYSQVTLCSVGKMRNKSAHSVIAEAFIGPCPDGMEVCHENGIRTDNRLANLRYDTRKGNLSDRIRHGTDNAGIRNPSAKLTEEKVKSIRNDYAAGKYTQRELASMFGVTCACVGYAISRKSWKHV